MRNDVTTCKIHMMSHKIPTAFRWLQVHNQLIKLQNNLLAVIFFPFIYDIFVLFKTFF